ncbi:hypothetical protein AMAG_20270 [Allomyces macrogynus ATCC 38327]|uniref:Uncharacterized protein n=1 Tax=Allomyces macrogynus (strain ATCC 38327) TaxID=578462 RepID=A0A0L0T8C8_ALLM3|nr:hypothetical protein AMAG_20270 [Allomyces macrogynus ATCC 38327]|eukprot:KNE70992.1 hypothetical protein AMAG_20270 [Allomyces macrogynus ATCC 38327]
MGLVEFLERPSDIAFGIERRLEYTIEEQATLDPLYNPTPTCRRRWPATRATAPSTAILRSTDEAKRATQADLDALVARRAALEQQLHRKIEYEAIMADVRKTQSRAALNLQTNDLELAIAALRQRLVDQTCHAAERRTELQRALRAVAGVRDGVRDEMAARAEMQRELAADVAAASGRPGSTAPGTPAAAAGGGHSRAHTGAEEGEIGGRRG